MARLLFLCLPLLGARLAPALRSSSHAKRDRAAQEAGEESVDALISDYIGSHSVRKMNPAAGFVVATYGCPKEFGNRMHEFLNAFAIAVISERNLVWRYTTKAEGPLGVGTLEECNDVLTRRDWIPDAAEHLPEGEEFHARWADLDEMVCYPWEEIGNRHLLIPQYFDQYQAEALSRPGGVWPRWMMRRAKLLFSLGAEAAYGKLFAAAFYFKGATVVAPTRDVLYNARLINEIGHRRKPNSIWVGVHLRHKDEHMSASDRLQVAYSAWKEVMKLIDGKRNECVVLLATDDDVTEGVITPLARYHACALVRSDLGPAETSFQAEHGNHTGLASIRDIELLSRADAFVGTEWSSFTMTIAERILARQPNATFIQCNMWDCDPKHQSFPRALNRNSCEPTQVLGRDNASVSSPPDTPLISSPNSNHSAG